MELFLEHDTVTAPDVVRLLGLPRTTVHELLATLSERGWVRPVDGEPRRYALGVKSFELGKARCTLYRAATAAGAGARRTARSALGGPWTCLRIPGPAGVAYVLRDVPPMS